jgi:hypothetical protein
MDLFILDLRRNLFLHKIKLYINFLESPKAREKLNKWCCIPKTMANELLTKDELVALVDKAITDNFFHPTEGQHAFNSFLDGPDKSRIEVRVRMEPRHGNSHVPIEYHIEAYSHSDGAKTFLGCTTEYENKGTKSTERVVTRFKNISDTWYKASRLANESARDGSLTYVRSLF